jgi:DNA-binding transcriptional LysR family regulator
MHRSNWDDLRFVLAVAQNGSVSAAARSLGVNHATVLRRVAAFEARHGSAIFNRTARGYTIAPNQMPVIEAAREVEAAVHSVSRQIEGAKAPLHGLVRVTSTDTFCNGLLPPIIARLHREAPDLQIELLCSNAHIDLTRMQADVTVRPAMTLPEDLTGTVAARLGFAVYGGPNGSAGWLGLSGVLARSAPGMWMATQDFGGRVNGSADSFLTLRELIAAGLGHGILPCILGNTDTRLVRLRDRMPEIAVDIWVASHADLADVPRVHAVRQHLAAALTAQAAALLGGD